MVGQRMPVRLDRQQTSRILAQLEAKYKAEFHILKASFCDTLVSNYSIESQSEVELLLSLLKKAKHWAAHECLFFVLQLAMSC